MAAGAQNLTVELAGGFEAEARLATLLEGFSEPVRELLLQRLGEFLRFRNSADLPADAAPDVPSGPGRLCWVVCILEDELIAAARAAEVEFHG